MPVQEVFKISIIIPVYIGLEETDRCLKSVFSARNNISSQVIIINDASPDPKIDELLEEYRKANPNVLYLKNEINLGFVETVNKGMLLRDGRDVVLLNSDTEVTNHWLDKLHKQAYLQDDIGTVTPFSNNATICNYPDLNGWKLLPEGETVSTMDKACENANPSISVDIPTAVGFCMYIKNQCLKQVGLFDFINFGKGYGEENDFCLRATALGWRHILAADTFVFHEGEVSFSSASSAKKNIAAATMRRLHPEYDNLVVHHIRKNEAQSLRNRITAFRYRDSEKPKVLMITHSWGGGTEKHLVNLIDNLTNIGVKVLILRYCGDEHKMILTSTGADDRLNVDYSLDQLDELVDFLRLFGLTKCHVHQVIGVDIFIAKLLRALKVSYDVTLHDYYYICPRINLIMPGLGYCDVPEPEVCDICLGTPPKKNDASDSSITWWRARMESFLSSAQNIYAPSKSTSSLVKKVYPKIDITILPHEEKVPSSTPHKKNKNIKVAILGVLANIKGQQVVKRMIEVIKNQSHPIEIVLIGYSLEEIISDEIFYQTGAYSDEKISYLIDRTEPNCFLFPGVVPETYSFTLTAAMKTDRPIIASNIGAVSERLESYGDAYTYDVASTPEEIVNLITSIYSSK